MRLETRVQHLFEDRSIETIRATDWSEARLYEEPALTAVVLDAPYASIYGHRARIEFLMLDDGQRILIETKRQYSSGSTDEKLPYVFENARMNIAQGFDFILVMEGDGWKPGAVEWIRGRAAETPDFSVMDFRTFTAWLDHRHPLGPKDSGP